jgi:hypothetical protein
MNLVKLITLLPSAALPDVSINLGDKTAITKASENAVELAKDMDVDSPLMAQEMQTEVAAWGAAADKIEEHRMAYTRPFDEAKKAIMDWFRPAQTNFVEAREIGRRKLADFAKAEQERVRAENARREAAARVERERQEAIAREAQQRAAAEAKKAEDARRAALAEQDAKKKAELEAQAEKSAMASEEAAADASTAIAVSQVITARPPPAQTKIAGMSTREVVTLEVVDKSAALAWFAANPSFSECIEFNETKLKALQKAMGDKFAVPGIRVTKDVGVAAARA